MGFSMKKKARPKVKFSMGGGGSPRKCNLCRREIHREVKCFMYLFASYSWADKVYKTICPRCLHSMADQVSIADQEAGEVKLIAKRL